MHTKYIDPLRLRSIFQTAQQHPSAVVEYTRGGNPRVFVNWAENCEDPPRVVMLARRDMDPVPMPNGMTGSVVADVRCRKCPPCLEARSGHWAHRALFELRAAPRSWFCTWTFPASVHTYLAFKHDDSFKAICAEESKQLTKMFKRMRKAGKKFRYLLVAEKHQSGYPHFHALLHETSLLPEHRFTSRELNGTRANRSRGIEAAPPRFWPYISNATLVGDNTDRAPWYVLKYAAKSPESRIRASQAYGAKVLRDAPPVGGAAPSLLAGV